MAAGSYATVTRGDITETASGDGSLQGRPKNPSTRGRRKGRNAERGGRRPVGEGDVLMIMSATPGVRDTRCRRNSSPRGRAFRHPGQRQGYYIYAPAAGTLNHRAEEDDDIRHLMRTRGIWRSSRDDG
jgi:hypothetical protein